MEPPAIVQDFATLFSSWKKVSLIQNLLSCLIPQATQSHSFQQFKEIWKENDFSMIFAATVDGFCTNEEWMNVLYSCAYGIGYFFNMTLPSNIFLAYLLVDDPRIQLGSLYCLYLLYGTQPYKIKRPVITSICILLAFLNAVP